MVTVACRVREQLRQPALVDVFDVHAPFQPAPADDTPDLPVVAHAVEVVEAAVPPSPPGSRGITPLLIGDFNDGAEDMRNEVKPGSTLQDFEVVAYSPPETPERIGVLAGRVGVFPSQFRAEAYQSVFLPLVGASLCGDDTVKWSDHCAQYVLLQPGVP